VPPLRKPRIFLPILLIAASVRAQPARIVSTFPSATETLFALGVGDRVVGVSTYCRYPPVVLSLPKVGAYAKPDVEKIALLRPDLVFIPPNVPGLAERLAAVHLRSAQVRGDSLADIYVMIHDIGSAAGVGDRADRLNQQLRSRLDAIRASNAGRPRPTALLIVGRTPGLLTNLIAAAPSTYLSELLEIAGGVNALANVALPYPQISLETVVRLNPDAILDMSMMGDATDPKILEERLRQPWLSRGELTAVRNHAVFGLASETLVTPGPRVVDAVEEIRSRLRNVVPRKAGR
jgi:iron complex transport system substrate-binding protein